MCVRGMVCVCMFLFLLVVSTPVFQAADPHTILNQKSEVGDKSAKACGETTWPDYNKFRIIMAGSDA